jgi:hypothetical protein
MSTAGHVYHFTDTCRLPWILHSGELRAGLNRIGGFPCDFLWATTDSTGDRTASCNGNARAFYRDGVTRWVRFTLDAADFETWPATLQRFPEWTPEHVARLERVALESDVSPATWRCRPMPLPLGKVLCIETKSYSSGWHVLQDAKVLEDGEDARGVVIDGRIYSSQRLPRDDALLPERYRVAAPRVLLSRVPRSRRLAGLPGGPPLGNA